MKVVSVKAANSAVLDADAAVWGKALLESVPLVPTPLALVKEVSPFLALSDDHGRVDRLQVAAIHNGEVIALRLSWAVAAPGDKIRDLNEFTDGVAALFPLAKDASAITMGSAGKPTNAWYWKAGKQEPYDVVAEGFGTSERRSAGTSGLAVTSKFANGRWNVVFRRPLSGDRSSVRFVPGETSGIAFAVWSGDNRERSGRKSFSGEFMPFDIAGVRR
jgi:ethylbenzene hydroxylase subunit gamma/complex iron-sulfur molybdoenzyme family reductase subunit gamma